MDTIKIKAEIAGYTELLSKYEKLFLADGVIDEDEQAMLDSLKGLIAKIQASLSDNVTDTSELDELKALMNDFDHLKNEIEAMLLVFGL